MDNPQPSPSQSPNEAYQALLEEIAEEIRPELGRGRVADYIAPLARERAHDFAMAVVLPDGRSFQAGRADRRFSIQSISKLLKQNNSPLV